MLDTIKLRIQGKHKFDIIRPSVFTPEFKIRSFHQLSPEERNKKNSRVPYINSFIAHPSPTGYYLPKVEIYENANTEQLSVDYSITIECSPTKLLFENNLQELSPSDARDVFLTLHSRLLDVGVRMTLETLMQAGVSWAHFGKNILLPPEMHLKEILEEISKVDVSKAYDVSKVRFTNGDSLQLYCGVRELAFYDKVRDILKPRNRSIDKERTEREKDIVYEYGLTQQEILRFEYRLKNRATIRSIVNDALGRPYETTVMFQDLFSDELWKQMVIGAWQKLINRPANQMTLVMDFNPLTLLNHIIEKGTAKRKSAHAQNQALASFGIAMVLKHCGGRVGLDEVRKAWSNEHPERLEAKIREAARLLEDLTYPDYIALINAELERFKPIKLEDLSLL